jgi:hypothetical protein
MFAGLISGKRANHTEVLSGVKQQPPKSWGRAAGSGSPHGERTMWQIGHRTLQFGLFAKVRGRGAITILDGMSLRSCSTRKKSNEVAMTAINKQLTRHEIEELLPWYATGTLSGREAERIEQALAGDHELAQRYELVRRELAETARLNESLGAPSAHAMEKFIRSNQRRGGACAAPSADQ